MIIGMFSVIDSKTGVYSYPFYEVTRGSAIRAFMDTVKTTDHPFNRHPEDYALVYLGQFDDQTAVIVSGVPEVLISAVNCLVE